MLLASSAFRLVGSIRLDPPEQGRSPNSLPTCRYQLHPRLHQELSTVSFSSLLDLSCRWPLNLLPWSPRS